MADKERMEPQERRSKILNHVAYALCHLDGACWLADFLESDPKPTKVCVLLDKQVVIERGSFRFLTNPLAESGIIYCRKLLNFLGIRLNKKTGALDAVTNREPDDAGIEQLGLAKLTVSALEAAPAAEAAAVRAACVAILRAADKGVAHFTEDKGERAQSEALRICASATIWAVERHVYAVLNIKPPDYKVWTGGLTE